MEADEWWHHWTNKHGQDSLGVILWSVTQEKWLSFQVDDLLCLKRISRVTRCLYVLAVLASKDFAYHGPKLATVDQAKERKISMPGTQSIKIGVIGVHHTFPVDQNVTELTWPTWTSPTYSGTWWKTQREGVQTMPLVGEEDLPWWSSKSDGEIILFFVCLIKFWSTF